MEPQVMTDWLREFEKDGSSELRHDRLKTFQTKGFPTTKHEEWKYTSVQRLTSVERALAKPQPEGINLDWSNLLPDAPDMVKLVLLNGHFRPDLSQNLEISGLKIQVARSQDLGLVESPDSSFVDLNAALVQKVLRLEIAAATHSLPSIGLIHVVSSGDNSFSNGRILVEIGKGASCQLFETWHIVNGDVLQNDVLEVNLGAGASCRHDVVQSVSGAQLMQFTQVNQETGSQYHSTVLSTEGNIIRNNLHVRHLGQQCESYLNGVYLLDGNSHVDNHTLVDHAHPNCYSNELYKGVLGGQSTGVFNGKVFVRLDAQKTNAFQSNRTVLLTPGARMNTKPQLEIFADDVKCSHGATTGQLDEEALFYLQSRGLSRASALSLLTFAFAADVLDRVAEGPSKAFMQSRLEEKLHKLTQNPG